MFKRCIISATLIGLAWPGAAWAQVPFTQEQADQGKTLYTAQCESCHGDALVGGVGGGPPLTGSYFLDHWADQPVSGVFGYIKEFMPADTPGSLTSTQTANIIAYILQFGGAAPGSEPLSNDPAVLDAITLERPAAN